MNTFSLTPKLEILLDGKKLVIQTVESINCMKVPIDNEWEEWSEMVSLNIWVTMSREDYKKICGKIVI